MGICEIVVRGRFFRQARTTFSIVLTNSKLESVLRESRSIRVGFNSRGYNASHDVPDCSLTTRRELEELLGHLVQHLERKIPDTPERVDRMRAHKYRNAQRDGKTDEDSVEAYADVMDRIHYNQKFIKRLQEEEKESWK
jgi:hypothetical protein